MDDDLVEIIGRLATQLSAPIQLATQILLVLCRADRQGTQLLSHAAGGRLPEADNLRHAREVRDRITGDLGGQQQILLPQQPQLPLGAGARHVGGQLIDQAEGRVEFTLGFELVGDIDGNDDIRPHLDRDIDGQVVDDATIGQQFLIDLDRLQRPGDRHRRLHHQRQVAMIQHHRLYGFHVGGDGPIRQG